jgi:aminopeptidase N
MTEYLAVDRLHPEWHIWEEFTASDAISATNRDVFSDVQAVRVAVNNPEEIHTLFDPSIVYAKGGKLLKMLHDLLGDEAWRAGLKDYFEKHAYGNTIRDDLWNALSNHTEIDVPKLMNTWIEKPGQPLVTAEQSGSTLTLSQTRLLLDGKTDDTTWQIPLLGKNLPELFTEKTETITLKAEGFVSLNQTGIGHYITNYHNPAHKTWLTEQLAHADTETGWKISRLNELTMLAKHGSTSLTEGLEAIIHCTSETKAMVWSLIAGIVGNAGMVTYENETARGQIKLLSGNLAERSFQQLGWDYSTSETSNETHLRTIAIGMMIASERSEVIDHALSLFRASDDPETLPAEIRGKIMAVAAKFGTEEEFTDLVERYKTTQNADYKSDLCGALTATKSTAHIAQLHKMMLDSSIVRQQDLIRWYIYLLRNRHAQKATWQWLKENWSWIVENFSGSKSYDDFARYSANVLCSPAMINEYTQFFTPLQNDPALKRTITIGIEELKARATWRSRDEAAVTQWLTQYQSQNS